MSKPTKGQKRFGHQHTHHTHAVALIVLGASGAIENVFLKNVNAQVLVADTEKLAGLTPQEIETKLLLGQHATPVTHEEFEKILDKIIGPAEPTPPATTEPTPAPATSAPATEPASPSDPAPPATPPPAPTATTVTSSAPATDPSTATTPAAPLATATPVDPTTTATS